ncbi:MAG: hypothetical protein K5647_00455 [Clostridiales bacterium]|nr:hypothetical protein [Clostridiales bacterium]
MNKKNVVSKKLVLLIIIISCTVILGSEVVFFTRSHVVINDNINDVLLKDDFDYNTQITSEELNQKIEKELVQYADLKAAETVEVGDIVTLDYCLKIDNDSMPPVFNQSVVVGNGFFNIEIEESLVGHKKDEEISIVTQREDHYYYFSIKIISVKRFLYPEITEEFIIAELGFPSQDSFFSHIKDELLNERKIENENRIKENIKSTIIRNSKFYLSKKDLLNAYNYIVDYYCKIAEAWGCDIVSYAMMSMSLDKAEFENYCKEIAIEHVKSYLIARKLLKKNAIIIDQDYISSYCEKNNIFFENDIIDDYTYESITIDRAFDYLFEKSRLPNADT